MDDFQCVFAEVEGAVTAPATGLHFSRELMKRMEINGINEAYITPALRSGQLPRY